MHDYRCILSLSLSHTHRHSFSLSHTHTYTPSLCLGAAKREEEGHVRLSVTRVQTFFYEVKSNKAMIKNTQYLDSYFILLSFCISIERWQEPGSWMSEKSWILNFNSMIFWGIFFNFLRSYEFLIFGQETRLKITIVSSFSI